MKEDRVLLTAGGEWKEQNINRIKRGGYNEGEKQRFKGRQEVATEKPQRKAKDEEGEEEQVGWTVSMIRGQPSWLKQAEEEKGLIN
jgi:hypothetical protein